MPITYLDDTSLKTDYNHKFKSIRIIDVREPSEYAREHIPSSINIPLAKIREMAGTFDPDQPVLFHCRLGSRTQSAKDLFLETGIHDIYCLEGGIEQWKRCGFPVEINKNAPIDIMRQVQIVAGSLVSLGIILAFLLSSYFILLSLFVGLGLIFAGMTGFCSMAKLLMHLPWNKQKRTISCNPKE